ncbi:hypothetical protein [Sphingobium mellinum]
MPIFIGRGLPYRRWPPSAALPIQTPQWLRLPSPGEVMGYSSAS